jgi:hypothetical protein
MKILFFPQISNRSYTTGKWYLLKDAHITMIKAEIRVLMTNPTFNQFGVLLPILSKVEDVQSYDEVFYEEEFKNANIVIHKFNPSKNAAFNRFHFDMNWLIEEDLNYDIFMNDVPELTRNFKMFFNLTKKNTKIISNVHYIDLYPENQINPNSESNYFWRQVDGILCSEHTTFLTKKMRKDFLDYSANERIGKRVSSDTLDKIKNTSSTLDYMVFSAKELETYKQEKYKEKTIFFFSRCSDDKRTKWKEFIKAVRDLRKIRQDYLVLIANPTGIDKNIILKEIGEDQNFIEVPDHFSRIDYIKSLWSSYCSPLLYDINNNMSISFCEAMYCNVIPVQFGVDFSAISQLPLALSKALDGIDITKSNDLEQRRLQLIKDHCSDENKEKFISLIQGVL